MPSLTGIRAFAEDLVIPTPQTVTEINDDFKASHPTAFRFGSICSYRQRFGNWLDSQGMVPSRVPVHEIEGSLGTAETWLMWRRDCQSVNLKAFISELRTTSTPLIPVPAQQPLPINMQHRAIANAVAHPDATTALRPETVFEIPLRDHVSSARRWLTRAGMV